MKTVYRVLAYLVAVERRPGRQRDGGVGAWWARGTRDGRAQVTALTADPHRPAGVAVTLTARRQRFRLPSGRAVDGYTLNGQSPGPVIRATAGQLVQVRLVNESVPDGITLHWHGIDVPNAAEGASHVSGPGGTVRARLSSH